MINDLYKRIQKLELELASIETRKNPIRLFELIADDFEEIGSFGRSYKKEDILKELPSNSNHYKLSEFSFHELAYNCVLVKYCSFSNGIKALRSSIWKNENKNWKILHHQATIAQDYNPTDK